MNRRTFFQMLGITSLAWPIAKQIQLPNSHAFQPEQIIKAVYYVEKEHISLEHFDGSVSLTFLLSCPMCGYRGNLTLITFVSSRNYMDKKIQRIIWINHGSLEMGCHKCSFDIKFKFNENTRWIQG